MADLASAANYINDLETAQLAPNSEALQQRIGASVNYCLDGIAALEALNLLTSTPVALAFTSVSGLSDSYTTPNTKQIYAVLAISTSGSQASGLIELVDMPIIVLPGRAFAWKQFSGGSLRSRSLTIGGTNNRTVTLAATAVSTPTTPMLVIYEP